MKKVSFFEGNPALEGTVLVISSDSPLKALNSDNFRPFFLQEKYAPLLDSWNAVHSILHMLLF